jgi:hypothetical protein
VFNILSVHEIFGEVNPLANPQVALENLNADVENLRGCSGCCDMLLLLAIAETHLACFSTVSTGVERPLRGPLWSHMNSRRRELGIVAAEGDEWLARCKERPIGTELFS